MSDLAGKKIVLLGGTGILGNAIAKLIAEEFENTMELSFFFSDEELKPCDRVHEVLEVRSRGALGRREEDS